MTVDRALVSVLESRGIRIGTSLENTVALRLSRWNLLDRQQYRVGKYRLDFAWPDQKIGIEADGPHHWRPDVAMKDAIRDSWLRSQGWLIFRVDEMNGNLDDQLCRVACILNDPHSA